MAKSQVEKKHVHKDKFALIHPLTLAPFHLIGHITSDVTLEDQACKGEPMGDEGGHSYTITLMQLHIYKQNMILVSIFLSQSL